MIIDISKTFSNELISKVLKFVDTLDSAQKEKLFSPEFAMISFS